MSKNKDSDFFRESVADAKRVRQTAIENAKDYLEEEFTPKLQSMLSQTIQQEMEEEEGHEDEGEEVELDLDDIEDEMEDEEQDEEGEEEEMEETEDISDQQELNLGSVMEFLEAATIDDRHSDPDAADEVSQNPHQYDDEDLETDEFEGGYDSIEDLTSELDQNNTNMSDVDKIAEALGEEDELSEELEDEMVDVFLDVLGEAEHGGEAMGDYDEMMGGHGEEAMGDYDEMMGHGEGMGDYDEMMGHGEMMDQEEMEDMDMGEFMDMVGMDMDEFMDAMEMEDEEEEEEEMEETVYEIDLNEFGSGTVDQPERPGTANVSDPYDTSADVADGDGLDVSTEPYDAGSEDSGTGDIDSEEPVTEDISVSGLFESDRSGQQNKNLREELKKHRQAVKILRNKINEVNLINSKLLYTNRLFKKHTLDERQKMRIIESFDETSSVREAKLVYKTLSENLNDNGQEEIQESRKSSKKDQLVEALKGGLGSKKTGGSTTPSEDKKQILNEDADTKDRLQKLAGLVD